MDTKYIAAHQDTNHIEFGKLSSTAQANVIADHLAAQAHELRVSNPTTLLMKGQPCIVRHQGEYIGGNIGRTIPLTVSRK